MATVEVVQMTKCSTMYKHYRICDAWQAALKRIGCTDTSVIEVYSDQPSIISPPTTPNLLLTSEITYDVAHSWGNSFRRMIQHPVARILFKEFCNEEGNVENLIFWETVEAYRTLTSDDELNDVAGEVYKQFCTESGKDHVQLDSSCRSNLKRSIQKPNRQTFDEAQLQIYKYMEKDIYPQFIVSDIYKNYAADLIPLKIMQSWSSSFYTMMKYDEGRRLFEEFLRLELAEDNLLFWEASQTYKTLKNNEKKLKQRAAEIYAEFVASDADKEISVETKTKEEIKKKYEKGDLNVFEVAADEAYTLMKREHFVRFGKSDVLKKFLNRQIESLKNSQKNKIPISIVKNWSTDFDLLMKYELGRQLLAEYQAMEHADENIRFWEAVQIYKTIDDVSKRKERAKEIFNEFISTDAETEVNIDDKSRQNVAQLYPKGDVNAFDAAEDHIYTLMKRDSFPKFIRSDYFKKFLITQLNGQKFITPLNDMRNWSNDFEKLIKSDFGLHLLGEYLTVEHAGENIRFLEQVKYYKTLEIEQKRKQLAREIYKEFVSTDAENEINIDDKSRQSVKDQYEKGDVEAFDLAADHVMTLIKRDKYPKFVRSDFFKKFIDSLKEIKPFVPAYIVHGWTNNFDSLMKHDYGRVLFTDFLEAEYSNETIRFWEAVQSYKEIDDDRKRKTKAKEIYNEFISTDAPTEISLDGTTRDKIKQALDVGDEKVFEEAEKQIYSVMKRDSYPRFIKSNLFKQYAESNIK